MKVPTKPHPARPFIKWVGGKGQLLPTIKQRLPQRLIEGEAFTYIEPFIGGGAMLFFVLQSFPNLKKAVINDINPALVNAYRAVKEEPSELIWQLTIFAKQYKMLSSEEERKAFYLGMRAEYNKTCDHFEVETAARLIFLNKTCFNGLYRVNAKGTFNVPFGRYISPNICDAETIMADSDLLQRVEILGGDFTDVIDYVDADSFVYFDPPYRPLTQTASFNTYSKGGFGDNEQRRLKDFFDLLNLRGAALMLSNSDCRAVTPEDLFFDELYADYYIERILAGRMVNSKACARGKVSELLICNYPPQKACTPTPLFSDLAGEESLSTYSAHDR